jgi:hypothetical protein
MDALEQLRQLAREHQRALRAEGLEQRGDRFDDAVRRFVEDQCVRQIGEFAQRLGALPGFARQEAVEEEMRFAQTSGRERDDRGAGPGSGTIRWPAARTRATSRAPGSEMPGVPASTTSATDSPAASSATTRCAAASSLC